MLKKIEKVETNVTNCHQYSVWIETQMAKCIPSQKFLMGSSTPKLSAAILQHMLFLADDE